MLDVFFKLSNFLEKLSFQKHSLAKESKQYTHKWFIIHFLSSVALWFFVFCSNTSSQI